VFSSTVGGATRQVVLCFCLVHLTGATRLHHLTRKDQAGHVEYWKAQCGESRMLRLGGGKGRKLLPIRTNGPQGNALAAYFIHEPQGTLRCIKELVPGTTGVSTHSTKATQ
jgi:hypothetical protein